MGGMGLLLIDDTGWLGTFFLCLEKNRGKCYGFRTYIG